MSRRAEPASALALSAAGSRTAAPASWRRRTRWRRSASAPRHGYRAFECDVKLSADGVPFLLHDATLRAHDARAAAPPARSTWAELSRLDAGGWHSRAYAGEPLAELRRDRRASACATASRSNIEIKPTPGDERATGRVGRSEAAAAVGRRVAAAAAQLVPARGAAGARERRRRAAARAAARHAARRLARRGARARLRGRRHRTTR